MCSMLSSGPEQRKAGERRFRAAHIPCNLWLPTAEAGSPLREEIMDGLFVVLVILMTVIAYLVIRFIIFWNASRLGEDRQDQPNENQEHRQH